MSDHEKTVARICEAVEANLIDYGCRREPIREIVKDLTVELPKVLEAAILAERERCAGVADAEAEFQLSAGEDDWPSVAAKHIAEGIRSGRVGGRP